MLGYAKTTGSFAGQCWPIAMDTGTPPDHTWLFAVAKTTFIGGSLLLGGLTRTRPYPRRRPGPRVMGGSGLVEQLERGGGVGAAADARPREPATLTGGPVAGHVHDVLDQLDAHAGAAGDDEVPEVAHYELVRVPGRGDHVREVRRLVHLPVHQPVHPLVLQVHSGCVEDVGGAEPSDGVVHTHAHHPAGPLALSCRAGPGLVEADAAEALRQRLPHVVQVDLAEGPRRGQQHLGGGVRVQSGDDAHRLTRARAAGELVDEQLVIALAQDLGHLLGEAGPVLTDLDRELDE